MPEELTHNFEEDSPQLTSEQRFGLKQAEVSSKQLLDMEEFSQILEDYWKGLTFKEMITKHGICKKFGVSESWAHRIVYLAIREVVPEEDRKLVRETYEKDKKGRGGLETQIQGVGVFSLTSDDHKKHGGRGGSKSRDRGHGVHGLSSQKLSEFGKKAQTSSETPPILKPLKALGREEWDRTTKHPELNLTEVEYCMALAEDREYKHKKGSNKGTVDYKKVANELDKRFSPRPDSPKTKPRTPSAVKTLLYRIKKSAD